MSEFKKPQPSPTAWTQSFWQNCASERLMLLRCSTCGAHHLPTRRVCSCSAIKFEAVESVGLGEIITYTEVHRAPDPAFKAEMPYVIAIIELQEGVRLMSNIIQSEAKDLGIGKKVQCVYEILDETLGVPKFKLIKH